MSREGSAKGQRILKGTSDHGYVRRIASNTREQKNDDIFSNNLLKGTNSTTNRSNSMAGKHVYLNS